MVLCVCGCPGRELTYNRSLQQRACQLPNYSFCIIVFLRIFFSCCSFNGINYGQPNGLFNLWHDCHSKECNCSINRWVILFMFSAVVNLLSCRAIDRPEWLNYACTFLHQLESRMGGAKPGKKTIVKEVMTYSHRIYRLKHCNVTFYLEKTLLNSC